MFNILKNKRALIFSSSVSKEVRKLSMLRVNQAIINAEEMASVLKGWVFFEHQNLRG